MSPTCAPFSARRVELLEIPLEAELGEGHGEGPCSSRLLDDPGGHAREVERVRIVERRHAGSRCARAQGKRLG